MPAANQSPAAEDGRRKAVSCGRGESHAESAARLQAATHAQDLAEERSCESAADCRGLERKPAVAGAAQGSAGLKPLAPGRFAGNLQDVVQLVMAYRVERASVKGGGYRTEIEKNTIKSLGAEATISISFGSDAHSDHFLGEHATEKARLVTWEMDDKFWNMLKYKKGFGKQADKEAGHKLVDAWAPKAKSSPSGSDGASLDTLTKKTAPHFCRRLVPGHHKPSGEGDGP